MLNWSHETGHKLHQLVAVSCDHCKVTLLYETGPMLSTHAKTCGVDCCSSMWEDDLTLFYLCKSSTPSCLQLYSTTQYNSVTTVM